MEMRNICCSTSSVEIIQLGRTTNLERPLRRSSNRSTSWRTLWKKLMREKRKMTKIDCCKVYSSDVHLPGYDPDTYAQNFDQGLMWNDEPDNLSRTFSMRFAAPTKLITRSSNSSSSDTNSKSNSNTSVVVRRSVTRVAHDHRDLVICVF